MQQYYVIINNKEYELPLMAVAQNQEILNKYKLEKNNKLYLDIDKMKQEQELERLMNLEYQCTTNIQHLAIESQGLVEENWNKLSPKLNFLNEMIKIHIKKQEKEKAFEKVLTSMQISLEFKKEIQKQELLEEPHYITLKGNEYKLPMSLIPENIEIFRQYSKEEDNKLYLDIDKMIKEDKQEQVKNIEKDLAKTAMSYLNEEKIDTKEIRAKLNSNEAISTIYFDKQEKEKAYEKLKDNMIISLKVQQELEKQEGKIK